MIKSSYGRNLKRPERLNDSENNLIVKCSNENCTIQGNLQLFRHCTRCSAYFCNQCCDLSEKIIKLLNERSDNYWFCPSCTKPAVHAVFVEKDIEERCQVGYNYQKDNCTAMKRKLDAIDWKELFHGKGVNLSWKTFLKLLNDIILKYTPRFTFNNKRKKSIWMNSQAFSKVQLKNRAYHQYLRTKDHNDYNIYVK